MNKAAKQEAKYVLASPQDAWDYAMVNIDPTTTSNITFETEEQKMKNALILYCPPLRRHSKKPSW